VHRPTTNHLHTLAKHSNIFSVLFCLKWLIYLDPVKKNQKKPEQISLRSKSQPFPKIPAGTFWFCSCQNISGQIFFFVFKIFFLILFFNAWFIRN